MRMSATQLAGALVIGGALLSSTACGILGGADKTAACKNIQSELQSVQSKISSPDLTNPGASNAANAQVFRDTASKIRSEGKKAGGDVETSADKVATDLEGLAETMANPTTRTPNTSGFVQNAADLGRACGTPGA